DRRRRTGSPVGERPSPRLPHAARARRREPRPRRRGHGALPPRAPGCCNRARSGGRALGHGRQPGRVPRRRPSIPRPPRARRATQRMAPAETPAPRARDRMLRTLPVLTVTVALLVRIVHRGGLLPGFDLVGAANGMHLIATLTPLELLRFYRD